LEIAELGFKPTEAVVTNKLDFDINLKIGLKMRGTFIALD